MLWQKNSGLKVEFFGDNVDSSKIVFDRISEKKRKECSEKTAEEKVAEDGGLDGGLNGSQKRVLDYISENGGAKAKDMSAILSIPIDTLDKIVSYLIKNLLIERRGSKKTGGYWQITDK